MQLEWLYIAGLLNFAIAIMHIAIIIGGPKWYRFFGAGERMARLAEEKSVLPALLTFTIAVILAIWGMYAWAVAGILPALPFQQFILAAITIVYFLRGFGGLVLPFLSDHPYVRENSIGFWMFSSIICLIFAIVHLLGLMASWANL